MSVPTPRSVASGPPHALGPPRGPTAPAHGPFRNLLLAGLPAASVAALREHLERVALEPHRVLIGADEPIESVIFPETGVLAHIVRLADGSCVEANLVGYEGMVGLAAHLGVASDPVEVRTLAPGTALRMAARTFAELAWTDRPLHERLHRYTQVVLSVRASSIGCDRLHPVQSRLARWLLRMHDRVEGDEFLLTHDSVAMMLGVARPSVTVNALVLQEAGFIAYSRGRVRILDRHALEAVACECYAMVRREVEQLLGPFGKGGGPMLRAGS